MIVPGTKKGTGKEGTELLLSRKHTHCLCRMGGRDGAAHWAPQTGGRRVRGPGPVAPDAWRREGARMVVRSPWLF